MFGSVGQMQDKYFIEKKSILTELIVRQDINMKPFNNFKAVTYYENLTVFTLKTVIVVEIHIC